MDEAYKIASCVELITPARFLFNAGQTPKSWNEKMLNDKHFKVLQYEPNASKVFPNTEIKGGVAITIRDEMKSPGAIKVFTSHPELNHIVKRIVSYDGNSKYLDSIISPRGCYRTTELFFEDFPYASDRLGAGTGNMIASNFFERIPEAYKTEIQNNKEYIGILSRVNNRRTVCFMKRSYVKDNNFIDKYNVAFPKSNGNGVFGEALTATEIVAPNEGATDTFINIGAFDTLFEAEAMTKYIKTKFLRALLGVKKVTQDNPKGVWNMVPIPNFTEKSDIDWSVSIANIDKQLYKKYGLSEEEISFIENNVKRSWNSMNKPNIQTTKQVVPMLYGYSTPEVIRHNGWTKIGYTEQDVETRINQQTHTADIKWKLEWKGNATFDDGSGETFINIMKSREKKRRENLMLLFWIVFY